jgi:hypothetical protein
MKPVTTSETLDLILKLSVAVELLTTRVDTMQVHFREKRGDYSPEDVTDWIRSAKFLNEYARKKNYDISEGEEYLKSLVNH